MSEYRIYRVDPNNIAIQQLVGKKNKQWRTISYHGNNLKSLIRGLLELPLKDFTPSDAKLSEQLKSLELEIVSAVGRIENIVRQYEITRD